MESVYRNKTAWQFVEMWMKDFLEKSESSSIRLIAMGCGTDNTDDDGVEPEFDSETFEPEEDKEKSQTVQEALKESISEVAENAWFQKAKNFGSCALSLVKLVDPDKNRNAVYYISDCDIPSDDGGVRNMEGIGELNNKSRLLLICTSTPDPDIKTVVGTDNYVEPSVVGTTMVKEKMDAIIPPNDGTEKIRTSFSLVLSFGLVFFVIFN